MKLWPALALALLLAACGSYRDRDAAMTSMAVFEPARYAGLWYETAHFPVPFQRGCTNTRAEYGITGSEQISVRNSCLKGGELATIEGSAEVVGPGRLRVRLDGVPFAADYWVLWVDSDYRTAVVGTPSGRAGWILNREPRIPADRLEAALRVLRFNGYDTDRLVMTAQEAAG